MPKKLLETAKTKSNKALLVGVFTNASSIEQNNQMNELEGLVTTLGAQVIDKVIQLRKQIDVTFYI